MIIVIIFFFVFFFCGVVFLCFCGVSLFFVGGLWDFVSFFVFCGVFCGILFLSLFFCGVFCNLLPPVASVLMLAFFKAFINWA